MPDELFDDDDDRERPFHEGRIVTDPQVMVGKPVIKGTRIPVEHVIRHLAGTPEVADLFEAYPGLTVDDVRACFSYASDAVRRDWLQHRHQEVPTGSPASV